MDFHSLARKDLQSLCKKNKIPANLTNVAMADALKALHKVEGLDEIGNAQQSPERTTNVEPRTACRTSTRRKLVKVEPESSQVLTHTRRTTRRAIANSVSSDVSLPETPVPNNRKRGPAAASTRRKIDSQLIECGEDEKLEIEEKSDIAETPAIRSSRNKAPAVSTRKKVETHKDEKSVQRVYGTRQSVRVLEKTMEKLSLKEERKVEAMKIEGLCDETEAKVEPDESLENECEKCEAVEDSKTNDHEVDPLPENECEMTDQVDEDNKSEVDFNGNQNKAQFLGSESDRNVEIPEDSKANDCDAKLEPETCVTYDNLSGLDAEDASDSSDTNIEVETSENTIDMIHESIDDKGSDAEITENLEKTMNSDLETEKEKGSEGNQYESSDSSPFVMEAEHMSIEDVPGEISDMVNALDAKELTEDESKSFEMNQQCMGKVERNEDEFNTDKINAIDAQIDCNWHESEKEPEKNQYKSDDSSPFVMEAVSDEISDMVNALDAKEVTENEESKSFEVNQQNTQKVESNVDEFNTDETDAIDGDWHELDMDSDKTGGSSVEQKSRTYPPVSDSEAMAKMTSAEEFDKKTPITSLKEIGPCVSSPFAGNTIQGQFPRPTEKQTTMEKMIDVDEIINKENNISSGREDEKTSLYDKSLRQLTKALKQKLQIKNNNVSKMGSRLALQILPENAAEAEKMS